MKISLKLISFLLIKSFKFLPSKNKFFCNIDNCVFLVLSWLRIFEISFFFEAELFLFNKYPLIKRVVKKINSIG